MNHYSTDSRYRRSDKRGVVYFAFKGDLVKIGFTIRDPKLRAKELNPNGPPLAIQVVAGSLAMERELHQRFKSLHTTGEWFKISGDLKHFLDRLNPLADTESK